jgi:predicted polyphosphate/ATP-dependent NAD kinase
MSGRLGLIVNPVAGLGGRVGLKGSDGSAAQAEAWRRGGTPSAPHRALEALRALVGQDLHIMTASGAMGEALLRTLGLGCEVVLTCATPPTARDTVATAEALARAGVDLILFAGGDGTARDVMAGTGSVPVLGIPGGVKMYSGVFAANPRLAGRLAVQFLGEPAARRRTTTAEVVDVEEASLAQDKPATRLHGLMAVPASPVIARAKASLSTNEDAELGALCRNVAAEAEPGCLTIVGPGRTMQMFMAAQDLPKTLLGVDLVRDGRLAGRDCDEAEILAAMREGPVRIVVGLLGQQGCLFGRGNQQISAAVLRQVGPARVTVLATAEKVATLSAGLFIDTGEVAVDRLFAGYIRVRTGPNRTSLLRLLS